jgi:hypothetical protein
MPVRIKTTIAFLACFLSVKAQFVDFGNEPFFTNWKQIRTEHYQIIFPSFYEANAQRVAHMLETSYDSIVGDFVNKAYKRPLPVILRTRNADANAFVGWAPRRTEWFTIEPNDLTAYNWLEHLALHEQRHVAQFQQLRNIPLEVLLGESGTALLFPFVPLWYFEGDAIIQETKFSQAGRGREADFSMHYKVLEANNQRYSFNKALFGSYKHIVPNHYQLGYQLSSKAHAMSKTDLWSTVLFEMKDQFSLRPFNSSLKNHIKTDVDGLYSQTFDSLSSYWRQQKSSSTFSTKTILPVNNEIEEQSNYMPLNENSFLYLGKSLHTSETIYQVDSRNNKQKSLIKTGILTSKDIAFNGGNILAWSELVPNPRWKGISYSQVIVYDLANDRVFKSPLKNYYFAPDIKRNTTEIVAIEKTPAGQQNLVVFNVLNPETTITYNLPDSLNFQSPKWITNNSLFIVGVSNTSSILYKYHLNERYLEPVFSIPSHKIHHLFVYENQAYFISDVGGSSQVYSVKNNKLHQHSFAPYGMKSVLIKNDTIYSANYTLQGYRLVKFALNEGKEFELDKDTLYYPWVNNYSGSNLIPNEVSTTYDVKRYARIRNAINIHSWLPITVPLSEEFTIDQNTNLGFTLLSQNDLSTLTSSFGFSIQDYSFRSKITYSALFPVFEINAHSNYKPSAYRYNENDEPPLNDGASYRVNASVYVPLQWRYLNARIGITPRIRVQYQDDYILRENSEPTKGIFLPQFSVFTFFQTRTAPQNLGPRWGASFSFLHSRGVFGEPDFPKSYLYSFRQFVPGIVKNHSLNYSFAYEHQNYEGFVFQQRLLPTRGFERGTFQDVRKFMVEYRLPLAYPDASLGKALYIKRFRANLFYDTSRNTYLAKGAQKPIEIDVRNTSFGADLLADLHLFRFPFPFEMGVRLIAVPEREELIPELLLQLNY